MFPNGELVKSGEIRETPPSDLVKELQQNDFTGYASFTVKDQNGIHNFTIALIDGNIAGAFSNSFKTKENQLGDNVVQELSNHANSPGFYDVVQLDEAQVKLAVEVRPETQIEITKEEKQKAKQDALLPIVQEESKEEILKKYGLSSLADL